MIRWLFLSLALAGAGAARGEDAALFKADRLTLPRVDADGQVAQYQNAALARLPSGDFRLVYGLAAGTYTFTVNGVQAGQFTLAAANRYADDCHPTLERLCPP